MNGAQTWSSTVFSQQLRPSSEGKLIERRLVDFKGSPAMSPWNSFESR
jgi:hypothetical protein